MPQRNLIRLKYLHSPGFLLKICISQFLTIVLSCRYMKYLYPYECEKKGLSSPSELQAAIDSNRREGRRQSYGANIFNYSPVGTPNVLSPSKLQLSHLSMPTYNTAHISQVPVIKKGKTYISITHIYLQGFKRHFHI